MFFDRYLICSLFILFVLIYINKRFFLKRGWILKRVSLFLGILIFFRSIFFLISTFSKIDDYLSIMSLIDISLLTYTFIMYRTIKRKISLLKFCAMSFFIASVLLTTTITARGMNHEDKIDFSKSIFQIEVEGEKEKEIDHRTLFEQKFRSQIGDSLDKDNQAHVDIALYSKDLGELYTYRNTQVNERFYTASIIKVSVLTELLNLDQKKKHTMTESDRDLAKSMIENSNNEATTFLLENELDGYDGTEPLFKSLMMKNTSANLQAWGVSTTTAADQILLLNEIFFEHHILNKERANYIEYLMRHVEPDQDWGISAADSRAELKNGWLEYTGYGWIVNSIGHISIYEKEYTFAVLTSHNNSLNDGIKTVESISNATKIILETINKH